jgi:hypothetical protein
MAQKIYVSNEPVINRVYLPDEKDLAEEDKTWFEHRKMSEGDYQKYVDLTSTVKLGNQKGKGKSDEKAEVDMQLGATRSYLVTNLASGWNVLGENPKSGKIEVLALTANNINRMPPEIVKVWLDDIYEQNPILKSDEEDEGDKVITKSGKELPLV